MQTMVGRVRVSTALLLVEQLVASTALLLVEQLVEQAVASMAAEEEAVHMVVAVVIANSLLQIRRAEDLSSAFLVL
jgi:hypothetical protein